MIYVDDPITSMILGDVTDQFNNVNAANSLALIPVDLPVDVNLDIASDTDDSYMSDGDVLGAPGIAPYRLNLTALSQRYNIYAAAYRTKIHISRVRGCFNNTIPAQPDLVLEPPTTSESLKVGGYIDRINPHQMNHLIMGNLGDAEILLVAFDDGDVVAYYTAHIETALLKLESGSTRDDTIVKPIFHQNVGISAWGLAVHSKSRLIAVGTNRHEVHVFAFALTDPSYTSDLDSKGDKADSRNLCSDELFLLIRKSRGRTMTDMKSIVNVMGDVGIGSKPISHRREQGIRIVLETGTQGNNIPNVAFSSNADGEAVDVLAIDISGNLWTLNIWSILDVSPWFVEGLHRTHVKTMMRRDNRLRSSLNYQPRGWGVLVLPESSFLPTTTFQDSLGLSPEESVYVCHEYGNYIGIGKAVDHIKDNSKTHPWVRSRQFHRFNQDIHGRGAELPRGWYDPIFNRRPDWTAARDLAADASTKDSPKNGAKLNRDDRPPESVLPDGSSVMRTYEMDIELMGGHEDNAGIMFENVIEQQRPPRALIPNIPFDPERLSNLLHIPELSLVVAGSMCGRVVLITLTRPVNPEYSFKRGFKVDAILPKKSDEDQLLRPICPLLGVAIGPVPSTSGGGSALPERLLGERRYRILLHYYDHRILSYEIYRNLTTSELSIF
ncbi:hypothetical protein GGS21DRAFT_83933 [Xylaria nigripes]|nr:hypothetical protein GGS21DRAFT_83933 [Xylaria nigripes]